MAVSGDGWRNHISSLASNPDDKDELSPEDAAWVDSCLVKDVELSEDNWSAIANALIDAFSTQTTLYNHQSTTSVDAQANFNGESTTTILKHSAAPSSQATSSYEPATADSDEVLEEQDELLMDISSQATFSYEPAIADSDEVLEEQDELVLDIEEAGTSQVRGSEYFLPTYLEERNGDADEEAPPMTPEGTDSTENIFRVWELDIPDEEDQLIKQLRKAMEKGSHRVLLPSQEDPSIIELDDLITGLNDLSLQP